MRRILGYLFACLFCFLYSVPLLNAIGIGGTTGANFIKIGLGARPLGMGEAFVAVADDVNSTYWNPAGLANMDSSVLQLEHAQWFDGVQYEYLVFAQPAESFGLPVYGAMALSWFYLHMPDTDRTLEDQFGNVILNTGTFSVADSVLTFSYGGQASNSYALGLTLKVLNQKVDFANKTSLAFDMGVLSALPVKNLKVGMVLQNIGGDFNGPLPTTFKLGVNYKLTGKGIVGELNNEADILLPLITSDQKINVLLGEEYLIKIKPSQYAIRAGYRTGSDLGGISGLTLGLGYMIHLGKADLGLDYAFLFQGDLGYTHHFTLSSSF